MRRRAANVCVLGALLGWLSPMPSVSAGAVGSPASIVKKGKWVMSAIGGALQDRDLEGNASVTAYRVGHLRGYGITDWLSLYGQIGAAYLEVDDPSIIRPNDRSTTHRFGNANLLVTAQVKVRIWQSANQDWEWDGSVQYLDIRKGHRDENEGRFHEYETATSVAKSFGRIKPYVGAKWSVVNFHYKIREGGNLIQLGEYTEDGSLGPFFGTDVYFGDSEDVILNVETSFVGGPEFNSSLQYLF